MIKLIIVDDHEVVRTGLKQIFDDTSDIKVVDEAGSGQEFIEKARKGDFDTALLDISMPGKDGIDTLKELRQVNPKINVLVFTMYPEEQYAVRVIKAGASGYLNKECKPSELKEAIRKIATGRKYISPDLAELLASTLESGDGTPLHETLSDREFQVMYMIASGKTISEIADELFLSINTISTYRNRILEKMGMKNNVELTHYAIKNRLIE